MTTNQPELKACELLPCPFCNSVNIMQGPVETTCVSCGASADNDVWNTRPSPIIPDDAYPKPIEEKTVPEEFDNLIADDALLEAVNRSAGMQSFLSHYGHEMWVKDIETLVNRAIKGQKKPVDVNAVFDGKYFVEKYCVSRDVMGFIDRLPSNGYRIIKSPDNSEVKE